MQTGLSEPKRGRRPTAKTGESAPARKRDVVASGAGRNRRGAAPPPTHNEIALRAYELYVQSGGHHGRHIDHWLEAERQLRRERGLRT